MFDSDQIDIPKYEILVLMMGFSRLTEMMCHASMVEINGPVRIDKSIFKHI